MSRSKRKDFIKDKPRNYKATSIYWRKIRRIWRIITRRVDEETTYPEAQEIINDYDYCDYRFIRCGDKFKRK